MTRRRRCTRVAFLAVALGAALAFPAATDAQSANEPKPRTPIRHFVVLMQENHSFDNYFGTYPGADGIPAGACQKVNPRRPGSACLKPFHLGNQGVQDLAHNTVVARNQYDHGRMDGFVSAIRQQAGRVIPSVMGHYDDRDIPYYWNIADNYVLFDRFFTSGAAGSVANHMFWVTGTPGTKNGDEVIPKGGFGDLPTIFDRLEKAGVSWKFYVQHYDPTITFRSRQLGDRGSQVVWVPPLDYARFIDDPKLFGHIVDLNQYYTDVANGTLPSVAYIAPAGSSEHPPGSIQAGQAFVRTLINSLMRSSAWDSSAFTWSYDDWGGWYDHVRPPKVDKFGYGFRAPALLVSPYAKRGYIDHTTHDFTSQLKFIEENWGLAPLATRDARANSLKDAFDFSQPPREPSFLSLARHVPPPPQPQRIVAYFFYPAAVLTTLLLIGLAALRTRRAARRASRPVAAAGNGGPPV